MNKLSSIVALVAAVVTGIAAESAWSEETTPSGAAAPAVQTPAPVSGYAPGWYPPPYRGGYARPWRQPSHWPVPPRGYGQWPPHYPPGGQAVPATPAAAQAAPAPVAAPTPAPAPVAAPTPTPAATEIPPSAELNQAQEQLTAKSAELDKAHAMLGQLRSKLQSSLEGKRALAEKLAQLTNEQQALQVQVTELSTALDSSAATLEQHRQQMTHAQEQNRALTAERDLLHDDLAARDKQLAIVQVELQAATHTLQQAQSGTGTAGQDFSEARAQTETLNNELSALTAELESQKAKLANSMQTRTRERNRLRSAIANRDEQLAAVQAELQAATHALQQAQSETGTAGQDLSEARAQAETLNNELSTLTAELESRKATQLDTEQALAAVTGERDGLQADLAACNQELSQSRDAVAAARSEVEALHSAAAEAVIPPAPSGPYKIESAASEEPETAAAEVAAEQSTTTDADADNVPDSIDLCPETQQGLAVEATGCAAGVAIKLEGVNFLYDSHELTDEARRILDRVAAVISQHPELRLEVAGHTDATGDPTYNQWLSMQRAEVVRDYLVAQGVVSGHIGAAGYGGQRPIADNDTVEGLQKNRRVELRRLQ